MNWRRKIRNFFAIAVILFAGACGNPGKIKTPENPVPRNNQAIGMIRDNNLLTPPDSERSNKKIIRIGLLVTRHPYGRDQSRSAWDGARLAIEEENENTGAGGTLFRLVVRSCDGPWGMGSKQTVNLTFLDSVSAILVSADGRNSHLIEQVTAKTHVPVISAWATEPSLTEAFVPWFFRCNPDDRCQAQALINEIYNQNHNRRVVLIHSGDFDSRKSVMEFQKEAAARNLEKPDTMVIREPQSCFDEKVAEIIQLRPEAIVIFGDIDQSGTIVGRIRKSFPGMPVFANSWCSQAEGWSHSGTDQTHAVRMISSGYWLREPGRKFITDYATKYGYSPGEAAAYAYDGMKMLILALKKAGPESQKLREMLISMEFRGGVTGPMKFDIHGNRVRPAELQACFPDSLAVKTVK